MSGYRVTMLTYFTVSMEGDMFVTVRQHYKHIFLSSSPLNGDEFTEHSVEGT